MSGKIRLIAVYMNKDIPVEEREKWIREKRMKETHLFGQTKHPQFSLDGQFMRYKFNNSLVKEEKKKNNSQKKERKGKGIEINLRLKQKRRISNNSQGLTLIKVSMVIKKWKNQNGNRNTKKNMLLKMSSQLKSSQVTELTIISDTETEYFETDTDSSWYPDEDEYYSENNLYSQNEQSYSQSKMTHFSDDSRSVATGNYFGSYQQ